jgi:hypothetical protein
MEYKELIELIRDIFPKQDIRIDEEPYLHKEYPVIYIKAKTYSMEIRNKRIGTITLPDKWLIKLPAEFNIINPKIIDIPDQNIKEFIILAGEKLEEYDHIRLRLKKFHSDIDELNTNPQPQIRNYKLKQLIKNES